MKNIQLLRTLEATLILMQLKVKNFHWNLKGEDFFEIHEQLDKFYDDVVEQMDALAEKIVMLDSVAIGNFKETLDLSLIKEAESAKVNEKLVFSQIASDLKTILTFLETNATEWNILVQPVIDELIIFAHTWKWKFKASLGE
ncbi:Dps family protein [Mycoplasmopsis gallinarum]|uniref:DNA-binding ferritin-like protein n=1 Tax=Mycoplasmopsis gallinarum TaxID=29557 RepID=A0A168RPG2_9BACT|nr:DNA starvation/stationary phase protection protein [Mycoplasmopsis gallinarum]OAB49167.1 DNA-binding ferritin-like protein [Mycoplasmopsis gallinarum]